MKTVIATIPTRPNKPGPIAPPITPTLDDPDVDAKF